MNILKPLFEINSGFYYFLFTHSKNICAGFCAARYILIIYNLAINFSI